MRESYHHGDLERALREASLAILAERGAEGFTLREAARRAGVNHRAVYRHFADKRALLAAVAEEGYRLLAEAMRTAIDEAKGASGTDRLVALAEGYLRFARREPARYHVMFGERLNPDDRFPSLEAAAQETVRVLAAELRLLAPDSPSRARRDAGITLWASIHGLTSLVLSRRVPLGERHVTAYVATVIGPVAAGLAATLRK